MWDEVLLWLAVMVPFRLYLEMVVKHRHSWVIQAYKVVLFIGASYYGISTMYDKRFFPAYFFGPGEESIFEILTITDPATPDYLKHGYAFGLAFHVHNAIMTVFFGDTPAMIFHHFVTLGLIYFSATVGLTRAGSLVMLVHNIPDIFISLVKAVKGCGISQIVTVIAICAIITWPVFRLYGLSRLTIDTYTSGWPKFAYGLGSLVLLHTFWYYKLLTIFFGYKKTGTVNDTSDYDEQQAKKGAMSKAKAQ